MAGTLADAPGVLGLNIINEPFPGNFYEDISQDLAECWQRLLHWKFCESCGFGKPLEAGEQQQKGRKKVTKDLEGMQRFCERLL